MDGGRWYHKTADWIGDRYVVVCYNNDFTQHNRWAGFVHVDERTEEARAEPAMLEPVCKPIGAPAERTAELRADIIREASECQFVRRPQETYVGDSKMMLFGETTQPYKRKGRAACMANSKYPKLHALLVAYIDHLLGSGTAARYSTILFAKNSKCAWHRDKQNVGSSIITAFGDYSGGELLVNYKQPQPLFECCACHRVYAPLSVCRGQRGHTDEDWLSAVWRMVKRGELVLDANKTTRQSMALHSS
jgi:hypothetical protein